MGKESITSLVKLLMSDIWRSGRKRQCGTLFLLIFFWED